MTTQTPATAKLEKWLRIRNQFFTNYWLWVCIRIQKKNAESCRSRMRHSRSGTTSGTFQQRWADCEIFQPESRPDPKKLNPIQSWSAKFLKIASPYQSWFACVQSCTFILPH